MLTPRCAGSARCQQGIQRSVYGRRHASLVSHSRQVAVQVLHLSWPVSILLKALQKSSLLASMTSSSEHKTVMTSACCCTTLGLLLLGNVTSRGHATSRMAPAA